MNVKYINNLWVKIIASVVIGLLFASAGTKITYTCPPFDGAAGCVSFEKAVMHPTDLLSNKQDSLLRFLESFVIASLVVFALFMIYGWTQKRKSRPAGH